MSETNSDANSARLKTALGFWSLTIYGIGDILGAGIYALVGKVAGAAGTLSWLSFLVAMIAAALTGLSYSELVSRYPRSGGEATYTLAAFGRPWLSFLVGWLVFWSGVLSMATVTHACGNYILAIEPSIPAWTVWLLFLTTAAYLNFRGIVESSSANILFTVVEASGLMIALGAGLWFLGRNGVSVPQTPVETPTLRGVMQGAGLAFFAYIGFEDMVNVAEEVENPRKHFPRAIMSAVAVCGTFYILIGTVITTVLDPAQLSQSKAPLLDIVRLGAPFIPPLLFSLIALVAVANTGLLNSIMASRLLYGMANHGLLPRCLGRVHPRTRTPHLAVATVLGVGLTLVFSGSLQRLASTTSFVLLVVFIIVNASLLRIKLRNEAAPDAYSVPIAVPVLSAAACLLLLSFVEFSAAQWAVGIIVAGIIIAMIGTRKSETTEQLDTTSKEDL